MLDSERFQKFYKEVEFFLNNAPFEEDCSNEENSIYCELANLKDAIEDYQHSKKKKPVDIKVQDSTTGYDKEIWKGAGVEVR